MSQASRLLIVMLLVALAGPLGISEPSHAAVLLRVSPALVEIEARQGGAGSQAINVGNDGDEAVAITTDVELYRNAAGERSAVEWLSVESERFELDPGEQRTIEVEIDLPRDLESGGRYAVVSFTTGAPGVPASGAALAGKIGVAFFVTVKGEGKLSRAVELARFGPTLEPDGRIGFRALLQNTGNLHVRPTGQVSVTNGDATPFARLELPGGPTLLPGGDLLLTARGSLPLDTAMRYRAEAAVDYGAEAPLTAEVEFSPRPELAVTSLQVCENLDHGPTLTVELQNDGTLGLLPLLTMEIRQTDGTTLGAAVPSTSVLLWPGERNAISLDFTERLVSGEYVFAVRVDHAPPLPDGRAVLPPVERETAFRIGGLDEGAAPLCED